ncbi:F-box only protein 7 [Cynoglossus semilaevis]|uniref:F-box only protein 7 n=1 Tax=Cynoglossus semilaevis TaxID=244447 RepID=UPI00049628ED|nr:F-box only protein 7 [Cynoglossus semilaevis]
MKLRIRIRKQTCRVELSSEEPTLGELTDHIRNNILSLSGLSEGTDFGLSLNGSESLTDTGQTLSSYGIVSGDLICVVLPESAAVATLTAPSAPAPSASNPPTMNSCCSESQQASTSGSSSSCTAAQTESMDVTPTPEGVADSQLPVSSWEPMLCSEAEDGVAPLSLELLYISAQVTSPSDAIMVAGHLLMTETGFIPQVDELKQGQMPDGWRSAGGVCKLHYTHPLCENSVATLTGVTMGPILIIHATLKMTDSVNAAFKLQLSPCSYVTNEWAGQSAATAFKDLRKLSRVFKDQLAYPLIAAARQAMALPVAFGLAALPLELLLRIVRLLDVRSVVRLSAASQQFRAATADWTLWRHLCRRDFPGEAHGPSSDTDWKEIYKTLYKRRAQESSVLRPGYLPMPYGFEPPGFLYDIFVPPCPPLVPGIIGGEYDMRPILPSNMLPRPRYDPINPLSGHQHRPPRDDLLGRRSLRGRSADIRRGFI